VIRLSGIGVFIGAILVLGVGGFAAVVALLAVRASTLAPWETSSQQLNRYLAFPATCIGVGLLFAFAGGDDLALLAPVVGTAAGGVIMAIGTRNYDRRRKEWLASEKIAPP
jgi:hypothetical protein